MASEDAPPCLLFVTVIEGVDFDPAYQKRPDWRASRSTEARLPIIDRLVMHLKMILLEPCSLSGEEATIALILEQKRGGLMNLMGD